MSPAEQAFTSWLTTHGTSICPNVAFAPFEGMGRGLIATADIQVSDSGSARSGQEELM